MKSVWIKWVDVVTYTEHRMMEDLSGLGLTYCETEGMVAHEDEFMIVLLHDMCDMDEQGKWARCYTLIPKKVIIEIKALGV